MILMAKINLDLGLLKNWLMGLTFNCIMNGTLHYLLTFVSDVSSGVIVPKLTERSSELSPQQLGLAKE